MGVKYKNIHQIINRHNCSQLAADELSEHNQLSGIAALVIVPGNNLDELVGDLDTGLGIEGGDNGGADEVAGNDVVIGVAEDVLELVLGVLLHLGADVLILAAVLQDDCKVDDGNIGGGDTEGHTSDFAVKFRDNLTDGLGGTSGGGDDVAHAGTATTPVLLGGTVNRGLSGGGSVHGGHETVLDTEGLLENLADWGKAVGGA